MLYPFSKDKLQVYLFLLQLYISENFYNWYFHKQRFYHPVEEQIFQNFHRKLEILFHNIVMHLFLKLVILKLYQTCTNKYVYQLLMLIEWFCIFLRSLLPGQDQEDVMIFFLQNIFSPNRE